MPTNTQSALPGCSDKNTKHGLALTVCMGLTPDLIKGGYIQTHGLTHANLHQVFVCSLPFIKYDYVYSSSILFLTTRTRNTGC